MRVTILGVEHTQRTGNLLAWVSFEITVGEITIGIQGAQVRKASLGQIELRPPEFRSGSGRWLPSVIIPDEIWLSVLSELGTDWPPKPGKLRLMVDTTPPELAVSFAPHVARDTDR